MKNCMISELLKDAYSQLLLTCGDKMLAEQEAWWLLQHITGKNRSELLLDKYAKIPCEQADKFALLLDQRVVQNKPLSYILGYVPFCDLNILIEPPVLIPRPETEEWVCWLISVLKVAGKKNFSVLDLCCGSGCIGLAVAKAFHQSHVFGIDISEHAINLSKLNKIENQLNNIEFIQSDMFENLPENFTCDLIVSNPPYLSADEYVCLDADVRLWEDKNALVAGDAGMKFYETILLQASKYLNIYSSDIPSIVLEIGPAQWFIETLLQDLNYENFEIYNDMHGRRRWLAIFVKK
ncbi:MAG: Release factor glutamine methyltransferase [candidate division TM6 bacterium GW2011_GWF2_37_49]|nr:MAG: Release factor glutamine methyltransferase [candidate division TM6 bacterium GW2011_GWF2_37_49]